MKTLTPLILLLLSLAGWTQNQCDYILLQQFFYHLEAEKPVNVKAYSCTTYLPQNPLELENKTTSPCIFDANQHPLKHKSTCAFNRYGELTRLICTDPEGNIWEERAFYSDHKCHRIYISKNGSMESMYKVYYNKDNEPMISRQQVMTASNSAYAAKTKIFGTGISYSNPHTLSANNIIITPDNFFFMEDDVYYMFVRILNSPQNTEMKYNEQGYWTQIDWHNESNEIEIITEREIAYYDNSELYMY